MCNKCAEIIGEVGRINSLPCAGQQSTRQNVSMPCAFLESSRQIVGTDGGGDNFKFVRQIFAMVAGITNTIVYHA
jgi:hypothetical protein